MNHFHGRKRYMLYSVWIALCSLAATLPLRSQPCSLDGNPPPCPTVVEADCSGPGCDQYNLLVNGEAFFPFGWFVTTASDEFSNSGAANNLGRLNDLLAHLNANGINLITSSYAEVIQYALPCGDNDDCNFSAAEYEQALCIFLDAARDHDIYVLVQFDLRGNGDPDYGTHHPFITIDAVGNLDLSPMRPIVQRYRNHPALFGWLLTDELELKFDPSLYDLDPDNPNDDLVPREYLRAVHDFISTAEQTAPCPPGCMDCRPGQQIHPIMTVIATRDFFLPDRFNADPLSWEVLMWDNYQFSDIARTNLLEWRERNTLAKSMALGFRELNNQAAADNLWALIYAPQGADAAIGYMSAAENFYQCVSAIIEGARGLEFWAMENDWTTQCAMESNVNNFGHMLQPPSAAIPDGMDLARVILDGDDRSGDLSIQTLDFRIDGQSQFTVPDDQGQSQTISATPANYVWHNFNNGLVPGNGTHPNRLGRMITLDAGGQILSATAVNGGVRDIAVSSDAAGTEVFAACQGISGLQRSLDLGMSWSVVVGDVQTTPPGPQALPEGQYIAVEASNGQVIAARRDDAELWTGERRKVFYRVDRNADWVASELAAGGENALSFAFSPNNDLQFGIWGGSHSTLQCFQPGATLCNDVNNDQVANDGFAFVNYDAWDIEHIAAPDLTLLAAGTGGIFGRASHFCDCDPTAPNPADWIQIGNVDCGTQNSLPLLAPVWCVLDKAPNGAQTRRLFAGTDEGLFYSEDVFNDFGTADPVSWIGGANGIPATASVWDLAYDGDNNRLYAATDQGIFVSVNGGDAWSEIDIDQGMNNPNVTCYAVEVDPASGTVFVGTEDNPDSYCRPYDARTDPVNEPIDNFRLFKYIARKYNGSYYIFSANNFKPRLDVTFRLQEMLATNETIYRIVEIRPDGSELEVNQGWDAGLTNEDVFPATLRTELGAYEAKIFKIDVFAWTDAKLIDGIMGNFSEGAGITFGQFGRNPDRLDLALMDIKRDASGEQEFRFQLIWDVNKQSGAQQDVLYVDPDPMTVYYDEFLQSQSIGYGLIRNQSWICSGGGLEIMPQDPVFPTLGIHPDLMLMGVDNSMGSYEYRYKMAWNIFESSNIVWFGSYSMFPPGNDDWRLGILDNSQPFFGTLAGGGLAVPADQADANPADLYFLTENDVAGDNPFLLRRATQAFNGQINTVGACDHQSAGTAWETRGAGLDIADIDNDGAQEAVMMSIESLKNEIRLKFKTMGPDADADVDCGIETNPRPYIRLSMCTQEGSGQLMQYGGVALADIDDDGDQDIVVMGVVNESFPTQDDYCLRFGINGLISNGNNPFNKSAAAEERPPQVPPGSAALSGGRPPARFVPPNYPNPFKDRTSFELELDSDAQLRIEFLSVLGEHIATVFDGALPAGRHRRLVDASHLSSGAYVARLLVNGIAVDQLTVIVAR